jgi:hypothetical protein
MVFSSPAAHVGRMSPRLATSHTAWCRWMTSTRGTLPLTYVRSGLNDVIQPGPDGSRSLSAIEIVFWPGAMRTGPQRNFMWRTPSAPRVVVIVPCEVRTVVERAWAAGARARATSATNERMSARRTAPAY